MKKLKIDAWSHILPKPYQEHLDKASSGPGAHMIRTFILKHSSSDMDVRMRIMDRFPDYM